MLSLVQEKDAGAKKYSVCLGERGGRAVVGTSSHTMQFYNRNVFVKSSVSCFREAMFASTRVHVALRMSLQLSLQVNSCIMVDKRNVWKLFRIKSFLNCSHIHIREKEKTPDSYDWGGPCKLNFLETFLLFVRRSKLFCCPW